MSDGMEAADSTTKDITGDDVQLSEEPGNEQPEVASDEPGLENNGANEPIEESLIQDETAIPATETVQDEPTVIDTVDEQPNNESADTNQTQENTENTVVKNEDVSTLQNEILEEQEVGDRTENDVEVTEASNEIPEEQVVDQAKNDVEATKTSNENAEVDSEMAVENIEGVIQEVTQDSNDLLSAEQTMDTNQGDDKEEIAGKSVNEDHTDLPEVCILCLI